MTQAVAQFGIAIALIAVLAVVSFLLGWSRSDETLIYVGHSATALGSLLIIPIGPLWLSIAAGLVFMVNISLMLVRIRHS